MENQQQLKVTDLNPQSRLLITNEEKLLYVGNLHFLYGIKWMLLSIACFTLATALVAMVWVGGGSIMRPSIFYPLMLLLITGAATWITYSMPFWRSFFVITSERALIGFGQFTIKQEQVLPHQMEDWEIRENYFETLLGCGHLTLRLLEGRQIRLIEIPYLRNPHMFTRFLDEISPIHSRTEKEGFTPSPHPPSQPELKIAPPSPAADPPPQRPRA